MRVRILSESLKRLHQSSHRRTAVLKSLQQLLIDNPLLDERTGLQSSTTDPTFLACGLQKMPSSLRGIDHGLTGLNIPTTDCAECSTMGSDLESDTFVYHPSEGARTTVVIFVSAGCVTSTDRALVQ